MKGKHDSVNEVTHCQPSPASPHEHFILFTQMEALEPVDAQQRHTQTNEPPLGATTQQYAH